MPETTVNIFISAVSDEFKSYRKSLYDFMNGRGATVRIQERFVQNGHPTLSLLNSYIAKCDAVIHLVGDRTGKPDKHGIPGPENLKSLTDKLPDLLSRLGLSQSDLGSISYTQWEALLAIYHNKPLFIAKPKEKARRDTAPLEGEAGEYQRNLQSQHLQRLRRLERHVAFEFINRYQLVTHIQTNLSEILPDVRDNPAYATRISPYFPHTIGRLFKGREGWLAKIRRELKRKGSGDSCRIVIRGLGGLGKTRLALEYALGCAHEHSIIHLVSGESEESFDAGLAELYGVIKPDEAKSRNSEDQRIEAIRWLEKEENKGWLLIIDNVDSKEAVERIIDKLSTLRRGYVLITSRFSDWPIDFVDLKLDLLSESAGIDYLLEATESKRLKLDKELGDGTDRQLAKVVVNSLGQLALGIAQAAAKINKRKLSLSDYITQWNKNSERLLYDPDFNPRTIRYHRQLGTTWLTTYEDMPPDAKLVFDILCWLAPYPIPERLITNPWPSNALELLEGGLRCAIEGREDDLMVSLYDYDLASSPAGTQRLFTVHKLVQEVGRIWQSKSTVNPVAKDLAMLLLDREFVRGDGIENIRLNILPELRPVALHARGIYDSVGVLDSAYYASRAFRMLAELSNTEGRLIESEQDAIRSVDLSRKARSSHPAGEWNLAESLSILCATLDERGYLDRALKVSQEQQRILEELCTKEPENLAHRRGLGIALNNVGRVLENKGDNDGALKLFSQSQAISDELCTKEPENLAHRRDLGIALNNVGRVLEKKGDNDGALALFSQSQAISDELCTKEPENRAHQRDLGIALNNVGRVLENKGDNDGALKLFSQSQAISDELCTKEPENLAHRRDLGIALNNVGRVLEKKGDNDGALALFSQSQAISDELCTKEPENRAHQRDLGIALGNVGRVLENKGDNDGALKLFSQSQAIRDELCTKEPENLAHRRDLGIACFWVGSALAKSKRWQESAAAFKQAIKATQEVIDAGGSFGSLKGNLDAMTSKLQYVRDQINKK